MKACFFIMGFGYTAKVLAPKLISHGYQVIGTTRSLEKGLLNTPSLTIIDFNSPDLKTYLNQSTHLLISIPPSKTEEDLVLSQYADVLKKRAHFFQWVGYLSSTAVYGDYQGRWVDEDSPCIPQTPTGIARLKAEQAWLSFAKENQLPLHVFRLSGIYGPGRNVIERIMHGKKNSLFKKDQVFCRVHVEDIIATLLASMQKPNPLSLYNVSDDEPAPTHVIDHFAASLLNREPLPLIPISEAALSPMEQEFYASNRRVSNIKIKNELNVRLQYPTYREGLTQIWREYDAPK